MTSGQKYLFVFFSLYLLIISNTLNVFVNNFEVNFTASVLGISLILFLILFLFFYMLLTIFKKASKNIIFYYILIFFYFICLISNIHPNIASPGENLKYIFTINIIVALTLTLITIKFKIYNFFIITSLVTIFISTLFSSSILYKKYTNQSKSFDNRSLVSKKLNIFVISLDNIPYHTIEDEFKRKKDKSYLDDFVFFNKFISASQATHSNIIFEIYGNKLINKLQKKESEYINELKPNPNNFFNFVKKNNINVNYYGRYNSLLEKDELLDFKDVEFFEKITLSFHRFIISSLERVFTYKLTFFYNKHIGNKYHLEQRQSLKQFERFTKNIKDSDYTDKVVVNIGHWFFTKPIILDKNCQFVQDLPQHVEQMVGVGKCSMKLLNKFINILKNKGIYENSIIIFKSDTGLDSSYYSKEKILSLSKNNSIYGYSIYRPFLMVKSLNPNILNKINKSIISTFDLANYYCNELTKFIYNKSEKNNCRLIGNNDLYDALYFDKNTSYKKLDILFDDGMRTHLMSGSIFKKIDIIDGNVDKAFFKVFSD
jgi:hypothetical protein